MEHSINKQIALYFLMFGGITWGLIGISDINLIILIFGKAPILINIIYVLMGIAALYLVWKKWKKE